MTVRVPIAVGSRVDTAEVVVARIAIDTAVVIIVVRELHASLARDAVAAISHARSGSTGELVDLTGHGRGARRTGVVPVLPGWMRIRRV